MHNVVKLKQPDSPLEQASDWIAKLDRGLTPHEQAQLKQWLEQDEKHQVILLQMAKLWDKMDALSQLAEICPDPSVEAAPKRYFALAASVLFACLLTYFGAYHYLGVPNESVSEQVLLEKMLRTKVGESLTETLADGSLLVLNTNSRVKVTFTPEQRVLELQYGELHIEVAHNPKQPLSVYAGGKVIQAVGTAFNVQYYNNEVELLVTDGNVLVADQDVSRANPIKPLQVRLPASSLSLSKGEKSVLSELQSAVVKVSQSDIDAVLSWQKGKLIFRGESLYEAMLEVGRYTGVKFEFADLELKHIQIAGVFQTHDLDALLIALQKNFNIDYEKQGSNKVILKSS